MPGASWIEDEVETPNAEALPAVQMLDTGPALEALNDEVNDARAGPDVVEKLEYSDGRLFVETRDDA